MNRVNKPWETFERLELGSTRLKERLITVVKAMTEKPQISIYSASGSRGQAKGAYRMLSNEKFDVSKVQSCITASTAQVIAEQKRVLLIQDTTEIEMNTHKKTEGLGYCDQYNRGILLHTCMAVTPEGVPLGIMNQQTKTREKPGENEKSAYEKSKRGLEEKESYRWVEALNQSIREIPQGVEAITVCDRESDFYEFYNAVQKLESEYVVRVTSNRETETGEKVKERIRNAPVKAEIMIEVPRDTRNNKKARIAEAEVKYLKVKAQKPEIRKEEGLAKELEMNIVYIKEKGAREGVEGIEWTLATNKEVIDEQGAIEIINIYGKLFGKYVKKCLAPEMKEGDTLILDNASAHKVAQLWNR